MFDRFTDRAKKVMSFARQEAQKFNHEYIGTEHILLGLVQEGSGVAANVLKNMSIDLPFSATNALNMARGQEFSIRGQGRVGAGVSVGTGTSVPSIPGVDIDLSATASVSVQGEGEITLNVKRLEGNKVFVRVGRELRGSVSGSVGVEAGVRIGRDAPRIELPGGSITDFLDDKLDAVASCLQDATSVLFVTGAGISAESGIPTYRGIGGLYNDADTPEGIPIEEALSGEMMRSRPAITWRYIHQIEAASRGASFNRAHQFVADMERRCERVCVLTQNVDGFHKSAGSRNVIGVTSGPKRTRSVSSEASTNER